MSHLALAAGPQVDTRDYRIAALTEELNRAAGTIADLREELAQARSEAARSVAEVRRVLSPLHQSLRILFGEIEAISPEGVPVHSTNGRVRAVWESWQQKLPGKRAEFIKAMLEHGEMTAAQLRVATHTAAGSVAGIIHELKKLGLIQKNGGKYSLKEL